MRNLLKLAFALAAVIPAAAFAQIASSKHNLSTSGGGSWVSGTQDQICIFCHIPHRAQTTQTLWNRVATTLSYTWDAASTSAGTTLNDGVISNPATNRCMSCHDGSIALGDVAHITGSAEDDIGFLSGNAQLVNASGDISKNHPVAIPYAGQTGSSAATGAGNYRAVTAGGCTTTNSANDCVVSGGIQLPVYGTAGSSTIECGSCHEPHLFTAVTNTKFLRTPNTGSALCLTCHLK